MDVCQVVRCQLSTPSDPAETVSEDAEVIQLHIGGSLTILASGIKIVTGDRAESTP